MSKPITTRLRYIKAVDPDEISNFLGQLSYRVQIYGAPVWTGKHWFLWFVPPDDANISIGNIDLT